MNELIRVLLVEDNQADVDLIREMLPETGAVCFRIESVSRLSEALIRLKNGEIDLVLLDLGLPDSQGILTFQAVRKAALDIPIIVFTGNADQELAVTAVKEGAQDYLVKGEVVGNVVVRAARYAIERKQAEEAIRQGAAKVEASRRTLLSVVEDQKRTEDALRQSEEKFSRAFQTSPYAITITLAEGGKFIEVNDAFTAIAGFTREEALADSSIGLKLWVNEEYRQRVVDDLRAGRAVAGHEYRFRTKSGKVITGLFSAQVIRLSHGPCIISSINDITERKRAEEELRVALAKYKTLFDCFPLGINVTDEAGNILESNPTAQKLLGVSQDDQNKRDIDGPEWRIIRPDGTPMPSDEYASVRALKQKCLVENVEMGIVKSNKTITWINVTALPLPLEGHGVVITYNDISERKRVEESLKESEEKFRNIFDNSAVGKSITSLDGSVNVNKAFCEMLGYTMDELSHRKWQSISHPDDYELTQNNLKGLLSGEKKSARFIKRYFKKDGSVVWADLNTVLQKDKEGKPLYYITAVMDITERRRTENKIDNLNNELLQKNAELEQLIYVASHDLRSPLVNVQGFSKELGLLANELAEITSHAGLPDKQQARIADIVSKEFPEAQNYILASVVKMDALLRGLLKLSRLGRAAVSIQKIDINEMLPGILKTMEYQIQQCNARVEITALPPCIGDPLQVDQVFTNIIDNAIKYLSPDRAGVVRISGKSKNGISEYCVEDNGIGIAPQHQLKAFEIFHRLNPQASEGEGLGLAIVKKILSRLGGSVRLESEAGKGSRFFVTLPGV